ncbi:MAG TPA: DoxX family protein [Myxococcota bacterium]|nr:DoxX family protein [Myxococcota bacterium]
MPSRGLNIAAWVASVLLAFLFVVVTGFGKVAGSAQFVEGFHKFGYSDGFRVFIGVCEISGGLGLLIPRLATWAGAGLICVMIGAVYTHLSIGDGAHAPFPAIVGLLCAFIAWVRRPQALLLS